MLTSTLQNNSILRKINPSFKFLFFCLSIIVIFLPGGFFNQLILFSIFIPLFLVAKLKSKVYVNVLKTYLLMFVLFLIINWITIKNPFAYYLTENSNLWVGGFWNNNFIDNSINIKNTIVSEIYGGTIFGQVNDEMIQYFKNQSVVINWFNKYNSVAQQKLLDLVMANNVNIIKDYNEAKALLYLLNNDFIYKGVEYKYELVKNTPFLYEGDIAYSMNSTILYNTTWYTISPFAFSQSLFIANKIVLIIISSTILISTTTSIELTNGLERLLSPLKVFKFPASECALILSIGIRFIPSLLSESKRILNSQAARGLDFYNGNIIVKIKALIALIVPLFSISIKKSDDLANAMDARGYSPNASRTIYRQSSFCIFDYLYLSSIFFVGSLTISFSLLSLTFAPFGILEVGLL